MKKMFEKICRVAVCAVLVCFAVLLAPSVMAEECSDHTFNDDGFCTACGGYEAPEIGEGTADDPYIIMNAGNLYWFAAKVNGGETAICGKLGADITVNSGKFDQYGSYTVDGASATPMAWTPIGDDGNEYIGSFDGGKYGEDGKLIDTYTISGLYVNKSESVVGLFGYVGNYSNPATVKNVTVKGSYFCGWSYIGAVAGYVDKKSSLDNCHNIGSTVCGRSDVGGLVGCNSRGEIANSSNSGTVLFNESLSLSHGGIVGSNSSGTVRGCFNSGKVDGNGNVGGIAGENTDGTVENCYNGGTVTGLSALGGIVGNNSGYSNDTTVKNCYNVGTVGTYNGSKIINVGGIVGKVDGDKSILTNNYYQSGCAKDGGGTLQNGVGNATLGSTTADVAGQTESKTADAFSSGEVTYLLNGGVTDGTQAWYQTCGEGAPAFSGDTVYKVKNIGCTGQGAYKYSNTNETWSADHASFDADGFCTVCGGYEPCKTDASGVYLIKNAGNLYWFANFANQGGNNLKANAKLTADITVNPGTFDKDGNYTPKAGETVREWTPIGDFSISNRYDGTFDGTKYDESGENAIGNYIISGLYFNDTNKDYVGLFGFARGAVNNVTVENIFIKGKSYVGGIVGFNYSPITNCTVSGTVSGSGYVGGVAGYNENKITDCTVSGAVSGSTQVGGVVGENKYEITNCTSSATVSGTVNDVGGIAGSHEKGKITNCSNTGTVSGKGNHVGGVVGSSASHITNCYNTGAVTGPDCVGGVAGVNGDQITNCYNTGTVTGSKKVGGVAGQSGARITNCYNTGAVSGSGEVGGVVGYIKITTITNCYSTGVVSGSEQIGGVVGNNYQSTITNCYYLASSSYFGIGDATSDTEGQTESKAADAFSSGEVTYLLNGGVTDGTQAWYQTLSGEDKQTLPSYSGNTVYYGYTSCSDSAKAIYTNDGTNVTATKPAHGTIQYTSNNNGTHNSSCSVCGDTVSDVKCTFDHGVCTLCSYKCAHSSKDTDGFCTVCGMSASEPKKDNDVYLIYTKAELYWFAEYVNAGNTGASAKLMADITVNPGTFDEDGNYTVNGETATPRVWEPIANGYAYYYANFDGNGKTVSGLYCNQTYGNVGFFAHVSAFKVKDLHIANSYFAGSNAGAIIGYADGTTLELCSAAADVYVKGTTNAGGIVGYSGGSITNCYSFANIADSGVWGGLAGYNYGNITNSFTTAMQPVGVNNSYGDGMNNVFYGEDTRDYSTPDENGYVPVKPKYDGATEVKDFTTGEIAYKLQDGVKGEVTGYDDKGAPIYGTPEEIWGQTIDTDIYPTPGGAKVYKKINDGCSAAEDRFSNTEGEHFSAEHVYDTNGFCKCGAYEPAKLVDGVYEIANAGQLYWFAAKVNSGSISINAKLTADITVNSDVLNSDGSLNTGDFREWTPIKYYQGTFDGNGKYISGLYYNNAEAQYVGLFGTVYNSGVVKNVTVKDSYFCGLSAVGGVVASNYGTVENCHNSGSTVIGEARFVEDRENGFNLTDGRVGYYAYGNNIGGVVGTNTGTLKNCTNSGSVSGYANVGGVVGYNCKDVESCTNSGKVTGKYIRYAYYEKDVDGNLTADTNDIDYGDCVGGVVGFTVGGAVKNCRNTGAVSGYAYVGGVVGYSTECAIGNCYNTASVAGNSGVGGVVGLNYGTVSNCYNSGTVSGYVNVGGVVGYNFVDTVTNCYYLKGTASTGIGYGDGKATEVTDDQLKSGEVTWLLNGKRSEGTTDKPLVWYQTIDGKFYPGFTGSVVFYDEDKDEYGNTQVIISVTVSWSSMEFTFTDGVWNAQTHSYNKGAWTTSGGTITATNGGNTDIKIGFAFNMNEGYGDIDGTLSSSGAVIAAGQSTSTTLELSGEPQSALNKAKLGSITVSISRYLPTTSE